MGRKHILLVDDEDDIREVATLSLELIGNWRVTGASGGGQGISKALAEPPDAILLDVMMPDLDGPATLHLLQADPRTRDIPVIFLTAKAQSAQHVALARLGVAGTLTTPFDPMKLSDQVHDILAGRVVTP